MWTWNMISRAGLLAASTVSWGVLDANLARNDLSLSPRSRCRGKLTDGKLHGLVCPTEVFQSYWVQKEGQGRFRLCARARIRVLSLTQQWCLLRQVRHVAVSERNAGERSSVSETSVPPVILPAVWKRFGVRWVDKCSARGSSSREVLHAPLHDTSLYSFLTKELTWSIVIYKHGSLEEAAGREAGGFDATFHFRRQMGCVRTSLLIAPTAQGGILERELWNACTSARRRVCC